MSGLCEKSSVAAYLDPKGGFLLLVSYGLGFRV